MRLFTLFIFVFISQNAFTYEREKSYTRQNVQNRIDAIRFSPVSKKMAREELKKHNVFFKDEVTLRNFSEENLNSILAAIKLLPKDFQFFYPRLILESHSIPSAFGSYAFDPWGENGIGSHHIILTEDWSKAESYNQIGTVVHELGHLFGTILASVQESQQWQDSQCAWDVEMGIFWTTQCTSHHISKYSTTNPREDWAESFTAYVLDPQELEDVSQIKHDFIKAIFSIDPESFDASSILKMVSLQKRKFIKNESSMYKSCINSFGKNKKNECLGIAMFPHKELTKILSEELGPQSHQFFSSLFKKITLKP